MRIILFGIPEFGSILLETLLQHKKNVVAVVTPPAKHIAYNSTKIMAQSLGVNYIDVKSCINQKFKL